MLNGTRQITTPRRSMMPSASDAPIANPENTRFGTGWISGLFSIVLGVIGLGSVLCLLFPSFFTVPEARALYPMPYIRALIHIILVAGFLFGVICICLRKWRVLGL